MGGINKENVLRFQISVSESVIVHEFHGPAELNIKTNFD